MLFRTRSILVYSRYHLVLVEPGIETTVAFSETNFVNADAQVCHAGTLP